MSATHTRELLRTWVLPYISRLKMGKLKSFIGNGTKNPFLKLVALAGASNGCLVPAAGRLVWQRANN